MNSARPSNSTLAASGLVQSSGLALSSSLPPLSVSSPIFGSSRGVSFSSSSQSLKLNLLYTSSSILPTTFSVESSPEPFSSSVLSSSSIVESSGPLSSSETTISSYLLSTFSSSLAISSETSFQNTLLSSSLDSFLSPLTSSDLPALSPSTTSDDITSITTNSVTTENSPFTPTEFEYISTEIIYKTYVSDNYTSTSTALHIVTKFNSVNPSTTKHSFSSRTTTAGELITSSPAGTSSNSTPTPTSTIVGSTIGSFAGVALIGIFAFLLFARQRRKNRSSDGTSKNDDFFFNAPPPIANGDICRLANDSNENISYGTGMNGQGSGSSLLSSLFSPFFTKARMLPKSVTNNNNINEKTGANINNPEMDYNIFYRQPRHRTNGSNNTTTSPVTAINRDDPGMVDINRSVISDPSERYSSSGDERDGDSRGGLSRNDNNSYYRPHSYHRDSQISDDLTTVNSIQAGEEDYYYAPNESETINNDYDSTDTSGKTTRYPLAPQPQLRVVNADHESDLTSILEESESEPESELDNTVRYNSEGLGQDYEEFGFEQSNYSQNFSGDTNTYTDTLYHDQPGINPNGAYLDVAPNSHNDYDSLNMRTPSVLGADVSTHRSGFFSETGIL